MTNATTDTAHVSLEAVVHAVLSTYVVQAILSAQSNSH